MVNNYISTPSCIFPYAFVADKLGQGSTQATEDPSSAGNDEPFWVALNKHVENLHAVISGHGDLLSYS